MTTIRLTRATGQQWGFRLHGGRDFNQPLIVLKVSGGSIAENSNLTPGDLIVAINGQDASGLKHKEAEDLITRAGNTVEFVVQKGTTTWKPNVTPVGQLSGVGQNRIVTKTSLARNQPSNYRVAPGINSAARPFVLAQDGRQLVNNQFNTPINLYSEANIAETLSAQAEVLAGGAIGVNFKKNEKKYNYEDSEVYKMLKSSENEHERVEVPEERYRQESERQPPQQLTQTINQLRPVRAPEPRPVDQQQQQQQQQQPQGAGTGSMNPNLCAECERLIVGVFVRIKDKNLHVECFKCATCGQSLKNIGYFNINNKLYCDVHAQTVARNNPIAPGLEPFAQVPSEPPFSSGLPSSFAGPSVTNIPFSEPDNNANACTALPDLPPTVASSSALLSSSSSTTASTANNNNSIANILPVLPSNNDNYYTSSSLLLNTVNSAPICNADSLITASSATCSSFSENTSVVTGDAQNLFISTNEENVKPQPPFNYTPKPDAYSANIAPQPFHHSPTAPSHVSAPSKVIQESSFLEKRSFSSETVTKTSPGGSKFVWPPLQGNDDPVMLGAGPGTVIPVSIQPSSQPQQQSSPSLNNFGQTLNQSSSVFNQSSSLSSGIVQQQQQQQHQQQPPSYSPSSLYQNLGQPYKPVVPPKPRAPQTPYKPLSTLLAPASRPVPAPSAPLQTQAPVPPPFGGIGGGGSSSVSGLGNALGNLGLKRGQNAGRAVLPNRGRGVLTQPGPRIAVCGVCSRQIRGPFVSAGAGKFYCPEHFKCGTPNCARALIDIGFVEERGQLFCEFCWESYLAPLCSKCNKRIKNECLHAIGQTFHSQCFNCSHCHACFGNNRTFYLEDGKPYCEKDWNEMFTTKCHGCGYPIEAGDRWVEALNNNFHSQCFNCSACKKNLEGQGFFAKGGRPFCKAHAR